MNILQPAEFLGVADFDCERCRQENYNPLRVYMILCRDCGNKRCPQAQDHRFKCTGSNDVGQVGELK